MILILVLVVIVMVKIKEEGVSRREEGVVGLRIKLRL
jgi:hypothetical protein